MRKLAKLNENIPDLEAANKYIESLVPGMATMAIPLLNRIYASYSGGREPTREEVAGSIESFDYLSYDVLLRSVRMYNGYLKARGIEDEARLVSMEDVSLVPSYLKQLFFTEEEFINAFTERCFASEGYLTPVVATLSWSGLDSAALLSIKKDDFEISPEKTLIPQYNIEITDRRMNEYLFAYLSNNSFMRNNHTGRGAAYKEVRLVDSDFALRPRVVTGRHAEQYTRTSMAAVLWQEDSKLDFIKPMKLRSVAFSAKMLAWHNDEQAGEKIDAVYLSRHYPINTAGQWQFRLAEYEDYKKARALYFTKKR